MAEEQRLSSEEIARLIALGDESYERFPTPGAFAASSGDSAAFGLLLAEHNRQRADATPGQAEAALSYMQRAAAVDTGAIENLYETDRGFTFSVAAGTLALQTLEVEKGEEFIRLFEAQLRGYEMALDAATGAAPISESWIRQLHEVICAGQTIYRVVTPTGVQVHALELGTYKRHPNHVLLPDGLVHSYGSVGDTPGLVREFVEALRSEEFQALDAVQQAAYAHYSFVNIHPFSDGNGRVARALASIYLLRAGSIPLVVFADQKDRYFDALARADTGDFEPFVDFTRERAIATLRLAGDLYRRASDPPLAASLEALHGAYLESSGLTHAEMDAIARRIASRLQEHLQRAVAELSLPAQFASSTAVTHMRARGLSAPWRARVDGKMDIVQVQLSSVAPYAAQVAVQATVVSAIGDDGLNSFQLAVPEYQLDSVIGRSEAHPEISTDLDLRLRVAAERIVGHAVHELKKAIDPLLRRK